MRRSPGFTLIELAVVICFAAVIAALWFPRAQRLMDWLETERAMREVTTAIALTRHGAVLQATRARLIVAADTLRIDRLARDGGWEPWWRRPGPASFGVKLQVSNATIIFGPNGMGWGASNTTITLRRGSQVETVTMSRVGRVKRW
jgi:Tfp pilus assembly protein FimT